MTLQIFDLALIGATTGLTSTISVIIAFRYMRRLDRKRKMIMMEEMMEKMAEHAESEAKFADIVQQFRRNQGEEQ